MSLKCPSRRELLTAAAAVSTVATAGCLTGPLLGENTGSIRVPAKTKVGDPLRIRLSDFGPDTSVTLDVVARDARERTYEGSWSLQTDRHGNAMLSTADMTAHAPKATWYGSEHGLHVGDRSSGAMVLHRLSPENSSTPPNFIMGKQNRVELSLRASAGLLGQTAARDSHDRVWIDPGITRQTVRTNGLVGWLYKPASSGPHPAVITLHGSGAHVPHVLSRMLASHGYATLALQYFGAEGLPDSLKDISLEYFETAIQWLTNQSAVHDTGVGLIGASRGVEAALLAAANYDGPATVIGYSGSGLVGSGLRGVPARASVRRSAWTRDGKPVAGSESIGIVYSTIRNAYQHRCNATSLPEMIRSRVSDKRLEEVLIPAEAIDGPVLLLAGADDLLWSSIPLSALPISRLQRHDHSYPYGLRAYCTVGHIFQIPYADYTGRFTNLKHGGTPKANARAAADAWPLVLKYLDRSLKEE